MAAINRSTDMTTGSIWKRMVSFAVPVFLGNLCQQLYNAVDSVIVGKFVGKQALAAVASSGNLIFMMTGFFMGLFIGAGIVIAQYFGARNYEKVRSAVHTDIAFALCCGVLLTLLGVFFTPHHPHLDADTGGCSVHVHPVFPAVLPGKPGHHPV